MSIKKYTNFEKINLKTENEGKFLQEKDNVIISKYETEQADFGECEYDVMEVSVYDINNNLLPHSSGDNVAYIKAENIKKYLYSLSTPNSALADGMAMRELAIDAETLLSDLGFTNGILKLNINFVRNRVGSENEINRAWIQEISATRNEIRILPLKTKNDYINEINEKEFSNLQNLNKDFKYYRESILNSINSFNNLFNSTIRTYLETQYGTDFFNVLRTDFGLSDFDRFTDNIWKDFTKSVEYYLTNKRYDVTQSTFGMRDDMRFDECGQYEYSMLITEIQNILFKCIEHNSYFLKRRDFDVTETPVEFIGVSLPNVVVENQTMVNLVTNPKQADIQPNEPAPIVVQQAPAVPVVIPPTVVVPVVTPHFQYTIKNTSSNQTMVFTFTDVTGTNVSKNVSPGGTVVVCAMEGSVSPNTFPMVPDDIPMTSPKTAVNIPPTYWSIVKMNACNTLDISSTSPTPKPKISTSNPASSTTMAGTQIVVPQPSTNSGCFVEGTYVTLANGARLVIEEITKGMEVLTWNEDTGKQEVGIVENLIRPISSNIISIETDDDFIECTADHPFFVIGKGWASYDTVLTELNHKIKVSKLEVGDLVLNSSDETIIVNSIIPINVLVPIQTYNLSISGNHTYYANDILVHNKLASNTAASNTVTSIGNDNLTTSNVTAMQINTVATANANSMRE
jgi:hypothetical protein